MKNYTATIGVYVRAYGSFEFEAENDESAVQAAITEFREAQQHEMPLGEIDWSHKALPALVSVQSEDNDIAEGIDFPLTPDDSRQFAADSMLKALKRLYDVALRYAPIAEHGGGSAFAEAKAAIAEAEKAPA